MLCACSGVVYMIYHCDISSFVWAPVGNVVHESMSVVSSEVTMKGPFIPGKNGPRNHRQQVLCMD